MTTNIRDFPVRSRPAGIAVVTPDRFLRERLASTRELVVSALEGMSARLRNPPQSPMEIARLVAEGQLTPDFGAELLERLDHYAGTGGYSLPESSCTPSIAC